MRYTIALNDNDMATLLKIIRDDFEYAYNNANEDPYGNFDKELAAMKEDLSLLQATSAAFTNENARMKIETIISDFKRKIRELS